MVLPNSTVSNNSYMIRKIIKFCKKFFKKNFKTNHRSTIYDIDHFENGWFDTTLSWDEIVTKYGSYSTDEIIQACSNSLLKVKNNEYPYERDSVLFDKIEYSWALVSFLMMIASENNSKLNLIDFGGSLGSSYFQNRKIFQFFSEVKWAVVEQKKFVEYGNKFFSDKSLNFFENIGEAINENNAKAIVLSSVIQYIEDFEALINQIINYNFKWIFIDRVGFSSQENLQRLSIQKVPKQIYEAIYPCWFFNYQKFIELFGKNYEVFGEFESYCDKNIIINKNEKVDYRGLIFRRIDDI